MGEMGEGVRGTTSSGRVVGSAGHRRPPKICEEQAEARSSRDLCEILSTCRTLLRSIALRLVRGVTKRPSAFDLCATSCSGTQNTTTLSVCASCVAMVTVVCVQAFSVSTGGGGGAVWKRSLGIG